MSHYHTPNLPQSGAPVDIYRRIHKALRFCMSDTLSRVSRLDIGDRGEVVSVLAQVREMAILCATHVAHEDTFVHPAMEARFPGTAKATAAEHAHHKYACRKIIALGDAVYNAREEDRESLVSQLYHYISLFVAESLHHLTETLKEFEGTLAYRRGGICGLDQARRGATVTTTVLLPWA